MFLKNLLVLSLGLSPIFSQPLFALDASVAVKQLPEEGGNSSSYRVIYGRVRLPEGNYRGIVNVTVRGISLSTTTDVNGDYSIIVPIMLTLRQIPTVSASAVEVIE